MRALVWDGSVARVVDRKPPEALPGHAIVRTTLAGVCNTDLEIARGYMAFRGVLGHELLGVVEEGPPEWLGKRVVSEINFACGRCTTCREGLGRHCADRTVMGIVGADGAFAERVSVPVANLREVPEAVRDEDAVFTEPLAAAFEILDQVRIEAGLRAVVLGDGKLGLLVAQVLRGAGAEVLLVGKHPEKLRIAEARGVRVVMRDAWRAEPSDLVVEATGTAAGFSAAIASTRPRGTLVLKSTVADPTTVDTAPIVVNELTLVGSRCGRFEPALEALAARSVDVASLVSARLPLSRADEALRAAAKPGVLKVLVEPD